MRTLRTESRGTMILLAALASQLLAVSLHAEERDASLRQRALQLNAITGKDTIDGEVKALLAGKPQAKKLLAEAAQMIREKPQPFSYNATLILGNTAIRLKDYRRAETFYQVHLEQAQKLRSVQGLVTAYSGLISAVYANRKYAEAEKLCEEAAEHELLTEARRNLEVEKDEDAAKELHKLNSFVFNVLKEQIMAVAKQGDVDRAIDKIDRLLKDSSRDWLAQDLRADVYRTAGKNEEALKAYQEEIQQIKDDDKLSKKDRESLIADVRYSLSGVYIDLDQFDKAVEELRTLLAKEPENPSYNNDLGFILADHDRNLEEAEKLIRTAIEQERKLRHKNNPKIKPEEDRTNAAYLDSLGWVLFKQKKYAEAHKYLQQAVEQEEGDHIEILDHLAQTLLALGRKSEAVAVWKRGVENASDTRREQKRKEEVLKKLKANE